MLNKENSEIICFQLIGGATYIGRVNNGDKEFLFHPFRLIPTQSGGATVAAIFLKEEFVRIANQSHITFEIPVTPAIKDLYLKYEDEIFSVIKKPTASEKSIILN